MEVFPSGLRGILLAALTLTALSAAQESSAPDAAKETQNENAQLKEELRAQDGRIRELEKKLAELSAKQDASGTTPAEPAPAPPEPEPVEHEHSLQLPGAARRSRFAGLPISIWVSDRWRIH